jgi:hypothetical protein
MRSSSVAYFAEFAASLFSDGTPDSRGMLTCLRGQCHQDFSAIRFIAYPPYISRPFQTVDDCGHRACGEVGCGSKLSSSHGARVQQFHASPIGAIYSEEGRRRFVNFVRALLHFNDPVDDVAKEPYAPI